MGIDISNTLYLRVSKGEFIFARYDHLRPQTLNFHVYNVKPDISLNANMHEALRRVELAGGDATFVRVLVEGPVTLVPIGEFDEDMADDLYFFNLPEGQKRRRVFYDTLSHQDAVLLFSIDKDVCHTLEETFPNLLLQSTETPLLLHFASSTPLSPPCGRLFVSLLSGRVSVSYFKGGRLRMFNSFELHHQQDIGYYTLRVAQLCDFLPERDEVYLTGQRTLAEQVQTDLSPYLPHVSVLKAEEVFNANILALQKSLPYDMIVSLLRAY